MSRRDKILITAIGCVLIALLIGALDTFCWIRGYYQYEREIDSYWSLADKASTISQKSTYIDKYVAALESQHFDGDYDAWLFPTPDNSFDKNMEALRSLQTRLREIQTMNPSSFEYQTAIQQITQQEQGEAGAMLGVFEGVWWKRNYFLLWDWVGAVNITFAITLVGIAITLMIWRDGVYD